MKQQSVLELKQINKSFGGIQALKDACFELKEGEIHALMGANGAGKSTMIKIIMGVYKADSGEIIRSRKPVEISSPIDARKNGITAIYQELSLVNSLTVAENIYLGNEPTKGGPLEWYDRKELYQKSQDMLDLFGIDIDAKVKVSNLGVGQKRIIEIVKALAVNAQVLLLDEPTTGMSKAEIERLFKILNTMKKKSVTMIYISHYLDEIFKICDRVTVLRDGKTVSSSPIETLSPETLVQDMLGQKIQDKKSGYIKRNLTNKPVVLELAEYKTDLMRKPLSLTLKESEIIGITGIVGAGKSELAQSIFGNANWESGKQLIYGKETHFKSPHDTKPYHIAFVPEDRKSQGIFLKSSIAENIVITNLEQVQNKLHLQSNKKTYNYAKKIGQQVQLRPLQVQMQAGNLSGGNQQKVVLGKWLGAQSRILLMDEPTRGIDVGAKSEIYQLILELAQNDKAIIVFSSEYEELMNLCDRILVLCRGEFVGELQGEDATSEKLLSLSLGG